MKICRNKKVYLVRLEAAGQKGKTEYHPSGSFSHEGTKNQYEVLAQARGPEAVRVMLASYPETTHFQVEGQTGKRGPVLPLADLVWA